MSMNTEALKRAQWIQNRLEQIESARNRLRHSTMETELAGEQAEAVTAFNAATLESLATEEAALRAEFDAL
jgi:hypothetical protein